MAYAFKAGFIQDSELDQAECYFRGHAQGCAFGKEHNIAAGGKDIIGKQYILGYIKYILV
ncbi:hypothetical protein D3C81_1887350 [compost metagenome]